MALGGNSRCGCAARCHSQPPKSVTRREVTDPRAHSVPILQKSRDRDQPKGNTLWPTWYGHRRPVCGRQCAGGGLIGNAQGGGGGGSPAQAAPANWGSKEANGTDMPPPPTEQPPAAPPTNGPGPTSRSYRPLPWTPVVLRGTLLAFMVSPAPGPCAPPDVFKDKGHHIRSHLLVCFALGLVDAFIKSPGRGL